MSADKLREYEFGVFRLVPGKRVLLRNQVPVPLTGKAFDVLLTLIERSGHLVEKSELLTAVWQEAFVEEANLTVAICMLRKALGDDRNENRYIETVPKRGYQFVAEVHRIDRSASGSNLPDTQATTEAPSYLKSEPKPPRQPVATSVTVFLALAFLLIIAAAIAPFIRNRKSRNGVAEVSSRIPLTVTERFNPMYGTREWEAYRLYSEGRYFENKRTQGALRQSIECYQQAVMIDPQYAQAYIGVADSYTLLASFGVEPGQEAYPTAKTAVLKALRINGSLPEAHNSLGVVAFNYEWNWPRAENEFRIAINLNPNYTTASIEHAEALAAMGRLDAALKEALYARSLDPASLAINTILGRIYYWRRDYDRAISTFHHVLELDPSYSRAHTRLGMTYLAEGNYPEAIHEFQQGSEPSSDPYVDGLLGYTEALQGNRETALGMLKGLNQHIVKGYVPAFSVAFIYLGLGDRDKALEWLASAFQHHSEYLAFAKVDPLFDTVRLDPRFISLLKRDLLS